MRFSKTPAWSGRMMSHSGLALGGAVVRGMLRMEGLDSRDVRVVMGVEEEGMWRKMKGRGRREGSIGVKGEGVVLRGGARRFWAGGRWDRGDGRWILDIDVNCRSVSILLFPSYPINFCICCTIAYLEAPGPCIGIDTLISASPLSHPPPSACPRSQRNSPRPHVSRSIPP